MAGYNRVVLIGNLGRDPKTTEVGEGRTVTEFSLATSESWTDRDGNQHETTEWHRIKVWGPRGIACARYLTKGRQAMVEGSIRYRKYEDKDGIERTVVDIVASNVVFLGAGKRRDSGGGGQTRASEPASDRSERRQAAPSQRPSGRDEDGADADWDGVDWDDVVPF